MCSGFCGLELSLQEQTQYQRKISAQMRKPSYLNLTRIYERRLTRLHRTGRKIHPCSLRYISRLAAEKITNTMLELRYHMNDSMCYFDQVDPESLQPGQLYWLPKGARTGTKLSKLPSTRVPRPSACILSQKLDDTSRTGWEVFLVSPTSVLILFAAKPF